MGAGIGRASRLRNLLYARLEETSFRSGVAVSAAVLVAVAVLITLAVTLGGYRAAPLRSAGAGQALSPAVRSAPASASPPAGSVRPASHPARKVVPPGADDGTRWAATPAASGQASPVPSPARLAIAAEPAWPQTSWPPAARLPAWMLPWPWDQWRSGQHGPWWDRRRNRDGDGTGGRGEVGSDPVRHGAVPGQFQYGRRRAARGDGLQQHAGAVGRLKAQDAVGNPARHFGAARH